MNTQTVVSNIHQGVVNTLAVVPEFRDDIGDTHTYVSGIHRTKVKRREAANDGNQSVSVTRTLSIAEQTLTTV